MRTVTFSDAKVAALVNKGFVATWTNRNPKFHNCEFATEKRIAELSGEAYATRNFCTFFVTPELDVLHYMAGYYRPTWFAEEAEFALAAWKSAGDGAALAKLHGEHAELHRKQEKRVREAEEKKAKEQAPARDVRQALTQATGVEGSAEPAYSDREEKQRFSQNARSLCEALTYLAELHGKLAGGRPKLDEVLSSYTAPNMFTEE